MSALDEARELLARLAAARAAEAPYPLRLYGRAPEPERRATAERIDAHGALAEAAPRLLAALCDEVLTLRAFVAAFDAERVVSNEAAQLLRERDRAAYEASGVDARWDAATARLDEARAIVAKG